MRKDKDNFIPITLRIRRAILCWVKDGEHKWRSQKKFAELAGVDQGTVSSWISGRIGSTDKETFDKIYAQVSPYLEKVDAILIRENQETPEKQPPQAIWIPSEQVPQFDKIKSSIDKFYAEMDAEQAIKLHQFAKDILAGKNCHCHDGGGGPGLGEVAGVTGRTPAPQESILTGKILHSSSFDHSDQGDGESG